MKRELTQAEADRHNAYYKRGWALIEGRIFIHGGGVRVEDMVIVTADGCESLNKLSEGLDWT